MTALPLPGPGPTGRCLCGCGTAVRNRYASGHNRNRAYESTDMHRRWTGSIITPAIISYVQRWLLLHGIESRLLIERVGDRNRVALRFDDGSHIYEAEVAILNALRKREPRAATEQLLTLFQRTA